MYPFAHEDGIVRNRWYVAAFAHEVSRQPMERTLLGKPVVMYRTEAGRVVAMHGLCPHRFYPLARGTLRGDDLVCGYHGFVFSPEGRCVDVPSQGGGLPHCQPTYRVEERGPLCWIWLGDPGKCDIARLPPHEEFGLTLPGWRVSSFNHCHIRGRYQLLVDNLMDLTHLPYLHFQLAGGENMKRMPMRDEQRERSYRLVRTGKLPWSPFHDHLWGAEHRYEGIADWESLTDFYGPELIRTNMPLITRVDGRESVPAALGHLHILHGVTPETPTSTHYFGFSVRNFRLDDESLDEFQLKSDIRIREQDVQAIEAVESRVEAAAAAQKELLVRSDGPAVKVRRLIQAMLDAESGGS